MSEYSVELDGGYVDQPGGLLGEPPDSTRCTIVVRPPFEPEEDFPLAVFGEQPSEDVRLRRIIGKIGDATIFVAESFRDDPDKPQYAQQHEDIDTIRTRIDHLLNHWGAAAKMTVEMPFADFPVFESGDSDVL